MKAKFKLLLLFLFACSFTYAQEIKVSGLVTSADDTLPLPGVNVLVQGTTTGTITDFDGNYTISAQKGAVLEFSSVGFTTFTATVGNQTTINVSLKTDVASLDEVVVIGYGAQKKADLTGAISTIKAEDIQKTPNSNVLQSLQGKVAGAQVVSVGSPGDSPTVRLRGVGSFGAAGNPLYVVDGVWYDTIDFLDSNQIESISVLKDVSSLAIFGQKAANGVIIITTKGGKTGQRPQLTYNAYTGVQYAQSVLKMANAEQFVTMAFESGSQPDIDHVNAAIARYGRSRVNPNLPNVNTDWYKEILRPATITSHSIGVTGGSDNVNYAVGTSYFSQDGILDMKNEYERFNINASVDVKVSDRFKIGVNNVFSNATKYNAENGAWFQAYFAVPILPVLDNQNTNATSTPYSDATILGYRNPQNPFPLLRYNDNQLKVRKVLTSIYGQYYFIPEKLSFKTSYSNDYSTVAERNVRLPYFITDRSKRLQTESSVRRADAVYSNQIWNNILNYNESFGNHNLNMIVGTAYRDEAVNTFNATGEDITGIAFESSWYLNFADPTSFSGRVNEIGDRFYAFSYFARMEYNFDDRYLVNATIRREGDSRFPKELYVNTGSVGIGWVISKENFMQDNGIFDFLKLRGSWGQLANGNLGGSAGARTVDIVQTDIGDQPTDGFITSSNFVNLEREILEETNFGISARLFDNRLSVEADYYIRDTDKLVLPVFQPIVSNVILENVGAIRNKGLEVALNWNQNISENWRFGIGANFATLDNEVTQLNSANGYFDSGSAEFRQRSFVGSSIEAFFGYEVVGVYQNNTEVQEDPIALANNLVPGDFKYRDQNGDGVINDDDRVVLGSYLPTFTYGGNIEIGYKNFDLSVNVSGQTGNSILNRKRGEVIFTNDTNIDADLATNRWHGEGTSNSYPSSAGLRKGWNQKLSTYFIEDGAYFRIQNIQLSYTIKSAQLLGKNMPETRVFFTADRPYTFFKYNGFDPEVPNGVDTQTYPVPAVYTVGVNIKI